MEMKCSKSKTVCHARMREILSYLHILKLRLCSLPSVGHPKFPARISSGFLRIPGRNIQESYQDIAKSWKIILENQASKIQKIKFPPQSVSNRIPPVLLPNTLRLFYICFSSVNSKLNKIQRCSNNCY